jgi:CheY-like chemotaxis protein
MSFDALPILLAEDNDDDVFILRRALKQADVKNPLQVARDGQELMDYLSGAGAFAARRDHPLPFLLLLDLKLPLHNGLEVLEWMRRDPKLVRVTVVVLTSSAEQRDLRNARELGARFYLVKPPKSQTLASMMGLLRSEWTGDSAAEVAKLEGDLFDIAAAAERRRERG